MRNPKDRNYARPSALLLAVALAAVTTDWYLTLTARRTPSEAVQPMPTSDAVARTEPVDVAPVARLLGGGAASEEGNIRLLGVIAQGARGKGIALLAVDGRPATPVRAGETIVAGATLAEVRHDRVLVDREGAMREIRLPPAKTVPGGFSSVR
jgi:general secretion pathway protein C